MFCRLLLIAFLAARSLNAAELPAYLQEALTRFSPEIPHHFAYTLTTERGSDISVERFDPSRPLEQQWTLLQRNGQPATSEENARYTSYRITNAPTARATFKRSDIDLASLHFINETDTHAEFRGRFREDLTEPMIRHLELSLTVSKHPAAIEQYLLRLIEPFSPILSVKILELEVVTSLTDRAIPGLTIPQKITSRFRGRILFIKSIEEDIQTLYSEFVVVTPLLDHAHATP